MDFTPMLYGKLWKAATEDEETEARGLGTEGTAVSSTSPMLGEDNELEDGEDCGKSIFIHQHQTISRIGLVRSK